MGQDAVSSGLEDSAACRSSDAEAHNLQGWWWRKRKVAGRVGQGDLRRRWGLGIHGHGNLHFHSVDLLGARAWPRSRPPLKLKSTRAIFEQIVGCCRSAIQ